MNDFQAKYLAEVSHRLQREGFSVETENEGLLPVEKNSHRLCNINMYGGMSYDSDFVQRNGLDGALDQVRDIVVETLAYMRQMMTAPPLLAEGLSGDYRLLAEFNHSANHFGLVFHVLLHLLLPQHFLRLIHCVNNFGIASAAANVASQIIPDLLLGGVRILIQQGNHRQNHTRCTEAALECKAVYKCLLDRVEQIALFHALNGNDFPALYFTGERCTGGNDLSVQKNSASAAVAIVTSLFHTGKAKFLTEHIHQRSVRLHCCGIFHAIDMKCHDLFHSASPFPLSIAKRSASRTWIRTISRR